MVSYKGEQTMDNGDIITYEDKYLISPGRKNELALISSESINTKTGEKAKSYRDQL